MKVDINDQAYHMVMTFVSMLGLKLVDGSKNDDGTWTVEIADHTYERLTTLQQPGESFSDMLMRAAIGILIRKLMDDGMSPDEITKFCAEQGVVAEFVTMQ